MTYFPIFGLPQPSRPTRGPKFICSYVFDIYLIFFFHILGPKSNSSILNTKDVPTIAQSDMGTESESAEPQTTAKTVTRLAEVVSRPKSGGSLRRAGETQRRKRVKKNKNIKIAQHNPAFQHELKGCPYARQLRIKRTSPDSATHEQLAQSTRVQSCRKHNSVRSMSLFLKSL